MNKKALLPLSIGLLAISACTSSFSPLFPGDSSNTSNYSNIFKENKNVVLLKAAPEAAPVDYNELNIRGFNTFLDHFNNFSSSISEDYLKVYEVGNTKNLTISPLSIYFAMAQAGSCAAGNTQKELFDSLNVDKDEAELYSSILYRACNEVYKSDGKEVGRQNINNSLWFDKAIKLKDSGLEKLVNSYFCEPYGADFRNKPLEVSEEFNKYLTDKTRGLINPDFEFDPYVRLVIANTLYMKDIWNEFGDKLPMAPLYDFANSDNSTTSVQPMYGHYTLGRVYKDEDFSSFYTSTFNGFKLRFIVPNGDKTIKEVFTGENILKSHYADYKPIDENNPKLQHVTRCIFPEFTAECNQDLINLFKYRGVNDFFGPCDFSNILDEYLELQCSNIVHIAKLKVEQQGIEGAAVTVIIMKETSIGPGDYEIEYHDYVIDKSFGFEISNKYDIPLFTGIVNKI